MHTKKSDLKITLIVRRLTPPSHRGVFAVDTTVISRRACRLTPPSRRGVFAPFQPADELGPFRGMLLEVVISMLLFFVVLGVTDARRGVTCNMPGLPIGCAVAVDIMCAVNDGWFRNFVVTRPSVVNINKTLQNPVDGLFHCFFTSLQKHINATLGHEW